MSKRKRSKASSVGRSKPSSGADDEVYELHDTEFADDEMLSEDEIEAIVKQQVSILRTDVHDRFGKVEARIDDHDKRIAALETKMLSASTTTQATPAGKKEDATKMDRFLDATLGTVGHALHVVGDTAAFLYESAVDIVTLGRARAQK